MKKGIYAFLAVLTVFAMVMMGCGDSGSTEDNSNPKIEGDTLVHNSPKLEGSGSWGADLGTANEDGSYTFDSTAGQYNGGAALYNFPVPQAGDKWSLSNYDLFEIFLKITDGSVDVIVKPGNGGSPNIDLWEYPSGNRYPTLSSSVNNGDFTYKAVISEGIGGIGFQRNRDGPATVKIEKVVYSKGTIRTITFNGGDYAAMPAINPIKIIDGRTVNFNGGNFYAMPLKPTRPSYTFDKWFNVTDNADFDPSTPITKDITLSARWTEGEPEKVDMKLNLDPTSWGELPPNAANQSGGWTWPSDYATSSYSSGVLTLTFSGDNRQRAIIPLSTVQVNELINTPEGGVTFKIDGTVKNEDGTDSVAEFRLHLGDPSGTSGWNGTDTGLQTALKDHLVEYASFSGSKSATTLKWFMIQAMYKYDNDVDSIQSGFPKVILTVNSITIDIGDTTND
jgi:uncharacterized repeat protein (TIGR02543 family)